MWSVRTDWLDSPHSSSTLTDHVPTSIETQQIDKFSPNVGNTPVWWRGILQVAPWADVTNKLRPRSESQKSISKEAAN
jgi:hypothetical protein